MEDITFIILGVTGDLTKRKLIPALHKLLSDNKITKLAIVGVSRSATSMEPILAAAEQFIKKDEHWERLKQSSHALSMNFDNPEDYKKLAELVNTIEHKNSLSGNRIFYFATLPEHFGTITTNIAKQGLAKTKGWSRLVYEKPFGWDLASAKKINKQILNVFEEKDIYRIDHYLGKELVSGIAFLRFANRTFEPIWNNKHVDSVEITMTEKIGIEGRGNYYDKYGVIKDVIQNHGLQLLALTAMEAPLKLSGEHIRNEKASVLKKTKLTNIQLGQYEGYTAEPNVAPNSQTPTYARARFEVNTKTWKGVPFIITAGKNLTAKETSITIKFKLPECRMESCPTEPNSFKIRIQPCEGFALTIYTKKPGVQDVSFVQMNFSQGVFTANTPEAYETLIADVILGDQSFFVREDEIEQSWKIIDSTLPQSIKIYPKGSIGPQ
ncbi:MAG TPA: glucose-6-phosphate dehydrogenase [Candidatus Nanoarchaeia archaeon]|nr:glucose-6-phosphate dehydrogenase [Candidatus Nanoarchaeia archaeon]